MSMDKVTPVDPAKKIFYDDTHEWRARVIELLELIAKNTGG